MTRPRTAQEFLHWLEIGAGARVIGWSAIIAGTIALSLLIAWKQFHGPGSETTLVQADTGRQLAAGEGFTTRVNFPQTAAVLRERGMRFDPAVAYPELHHAPLYPLVIAGALRLLPEGARTSLFASAPVPPDGFGADYLLLGLNLALLWAAAWLTFTLGRRLFEPRVGATAALGLLVSVPIWEQTVSVNGTPLLMVLVLLAFHVWHRADAALTNAGPIRPGLAWLAALGALCGLMFLTEYTAGALVSVALGYGVVRWQGSRRVAAIAAVVTGFGLIATPWLVRNVMITGHPMGLAAQNVALKAGDPTAEPAMYRATLSVEKPVLDLNKLGNKTLTALRENVKARFWSGGAMWLAAFFVAGLLYPFRSESANRQRWIFTGSFAVLIVAQSALNSGESERLVAVWAAPLLMVFGAAFFFVLLGTNARLNQWPRVATAVLLIAQALPLAHDALEPRRLHFRYPPYFPALFQGMRQDLQRRSAEGKFGLMADVPAGLAWYGQTRAWSQPARLRDFYAITLEQPIGQLLLTPRTLDRPFFSDLNASPELSGALERVATPFGEWGGVYAGLLTGALPPQFPLGAPQKLAENLFVLLNPALPPARGK